MGWSARAAAPGTGTLESAKPIHSPERAGKGVSPGGPRRVARAHSYQEMTPQMRLDDHGPDGDPAWQGRVGNRLERARSRR